MTPEPDPPTPPEPGPTGLYVKLTVPPDFNRSVDQSLISSLYVQLVDGATGQVGDEYVGMDMVGTHYWDNLVEGHTYTLNFLCNDGVHFSEWLIDPIALGSGARIYEYYPNIAESKEVTLSWVKLYTPS